MIAGINEFYGTSVPPVDVDSVAADDPFFALELVLETAAVGTHTMSISAEEFQRLRQWFPKNIPSPVGPDSLDSTAGQP